MLIGPFAKIAIRCYATSQGEGGGKPFETSHGDGGGNPFAVFAESFSDAYAPNASIPRVTQVTENKTTLRIENPL
jgi:hypothetical protein